MSADLHQVASGYLAAGLCVVPAQKDKRPALKTWTSYQKVLPVADQLDEWFPAENPPHGLGFICGGASGGLEVIDLDAKNDPAGDLKARYEAAAREFAPGVLERCVIESTPSGGLHIYFRSTAVEGNLKLAHCPDASGKLNVIAETRGEGGFIVASPTPGYAVQHGSFANIPTISADERDALLAAARSLDQSPAPRPHQSTATTHWSGQELSPLDDFNARGNPLDFLRRHGWHVGSQRADGSCMLRRPGKADAGWSATWNHAGRGTLSVFSSSTPFDVSPTTYSAAGVYAVLEHGGDYSAAARQLAREGFGIRQPQPQQHGHAEQPHVEPPAEIAARPLADIHVDSKARHESNLLGNGFLRRGGGLLFVAPTGVGKSTVIIQGGMCWATGGNLFGISAAKPLTSLYVQAENDDEDLEEISNGIIRGLSIPASDIDIIRRRFFVITTHERGIPLFRAIEPAVQKIQPDLLIIDPVLAFMIGEMNNQQDVTTFLRGQLHPFLRKHGMAGILIHHTPKPVRGPTKGAATPAKGTDLAYAGAGSFEFANWARAVVTLQPAGRDVYDLIIGKRWKRAGIKGAGGFPTDTVRIAHAREPGAR